MVSSSATTVDAYLASLPDDRRASIGAVRDVVRANLPPGYVEAIQYGSALPRVGQEARHGEELPALPARRGPAARADRCETTAKVSVERLIELHDAVHGKAAKKTGAKKAGAKKRA